ETTQRITSQRGIHLRLCRSIRMEGAFALLKHDFGFRRFLTRGSANIRAELFLLAMPFSFPKRFFFHKLSATYSFGRRIKGRAADFISATRPCDLLVSKQMGLTLRTGISRSNYLDRSWRLLFL